MKKVFVLGLILLLIVVLCSACGKTETEVLTEDDLPDEEIQEEVQEEVVSEATQEEVEVTNELVSGNDELEILRVTEEMAREKEGVYLKRGENYYTLGSRIPCKTPGVSYDNATVFVPGGEILFYQVNDSMNFDKYEMYALGDVPVPILKNDDLIVGFYSKDVRNCRVYVAKEVGYSIYMNKAHADSVTFFDDSTHTIRTVDGPNYELKDTNGNLIEDNRRLEKGKKYIFSWYAGSQYNETILTCMGKSYDANCKQEDCITIEPQFTQEGYVVYDFSSLAPGFYRVNDFGFIKIE